MRLLRENWALKLVSLMLALLLWLVVVNVSKPEITDYRTVELEIRNQNVFEPDSKIWEVDRTAVSINYTVRLDQRSNISASDFHAYIDLKDYSITGAVPIYVEVLNGKEALISNVAARPSVIRVSIEDVQEKQFDLIARQLGAPAEGYTVSNLIISPESVYATGPESSIGRISEIGVNIDVNRLSEGISGVATPVFYDANGNVISGLNDVELSASEISYTVTLHKKKSINILSSVRGIPAAGYQYESMTVSPDSIQLSAASSVIDVMTVFELPSMDIGGATGSITKTFHITDYLPAGVELAEPNGEINITVRIEKIPETETLAVQSSESTSSEEAETSAESSAAASSENPEARRAAGMGEALQAPEPEEALRTRHDTERESIKNG